MTDADFQQTVLDYFQNATQRHRDQMATFADVIGKLDEKITAFATTAAVHNDEIKKALAAHADTGAAGHAAVLDKIMAKIETINDAETLGTMTGEIKALIGTLAVPGQTPGPQ